MYVNELIKHYPQLFHLSAAGSWPTIAAYGLLSTSQIVSTSTLSFEERAEILEYPRRRAFEINHPLLGKVVIRDQTSLRGHILETVLLDMSVPEWLAILNNRVFFWLHRQRLNQLLNARRNRSRSHDVIVLDTASLIAKHHPRVRISPINSGATLYPGAPKRGRLTFQTIEDYPYADQRRRRSPEAAIVELTVVGGVPDIADHVIGVRRTRAQSGGSDTPSKLAD